MRYFLLLVFILLTYYIKAQSFTYHLEELNLLGQEGMKTIYSTDSNLIVLSSFFPGIGLTKITRSGNLLWSMRINEPFGGLSPRDIINTNDGGFLISGPGSALLKLDSSLNMQWSKIFNSGSGEECRSIIQMSDSSYRIIGSMNLMPYIGKVDYNGNLIFLKIFNGPHHGTKIIHARDGGYVALMDQDGLVSWFLKYDSNDSLEWSRKITSSIFNSFYYDMVQTSDGGFALAGTVSTTNIFYTDNIIIKTDSTGNVLWEKRIDVSDNDGLKGILELPDHGFLVCGDTSFIAIGGYVPGGYIARLDSSGDFLWGRNIEDSSRMNSILPLGNEFYLTTGTGGIFGPQGYVRLSSIDTSGYMCNPNLSMGTPDPDSLILFLPLPPPPLDTLIYVDSSFSIIKPPFARIVIECSDIVGLTETDSPPFSIYPNPSHGVYHLSTTDELTAINIYDILGKNVFRTYSSHELDISQLIDGIYFVEIVTKGNGVYKEKLIKN